MKQCTAFLLCIAVCFGLCACQVPSNRSSNSVKFYYCVNEIKYDSGAHIVESENFEAGSHRSDLEFLINEYLSGPENSRFRSPFPSDVKLSHIAVQDNTVNIILSNELATLAGYELTVACACLTLTVLDITQAESVLISADSALLNNSAYIAMDASCIRLLDNTVK